MFIPDVYEVVVGMVKITTLTNREYCVVLDPVDLTTGKQQFGKRELRIGEQSFFLLPGEELERCVRLVCLVYESNQRFVAVEFSLYLCLARKRPLCCEPRRPILTL